MNSISRCLTVLAAAFLAISPAMADCTRRNNPYQDLKDQLNLVTSDLHVADELSPAEPAKRKAKLGRRILRTWQRFAAGAKKKQREVPTDLAEDVKAAASAMKRPTLANAGDLRKLAKRVDDYSMTMTCAK